MAEKIEDQIKAVIADKLAISEDTITLDKQFRDLGADSLDTVELVMALETEFNVKIDDTEMEKLFTVGDAIELIKLKQK